jgi:hypothetical protein
MSQRVAKASAFFVFITAVTAYCQIPTPIPHTQLPGVPGRRISTQPRQQPCYGVAGVSKAAVDRRAAVARSANAQVEAICANAALTPPQRSLEIRQIRQQERAEINTIITPQQQEAIRVCNQERRPVNTASVPHSGPARGPCGELLGNVGTPTPHPQPLPGTPPGGTPPPTGGSQSPSQPPN